MKDLLVVYANGLEEVEALTVVDFARRAGLEVMTASIHGEKEVRGANEISILADALFDEVDVDDFRAIYLPGGLPGAENLRDKDELVMALQRFAKEGKLLSAICAAPVALDRGELLTEGRFTCYPGYEENIKTKGRLDEIVVKEGNVITGMGPALAMDMAFAIIEELAGKEAKESVMEGTLYNRLVKAHQEG